MSSSRDVLGPKPYRIKPGEPLTIDVYSRDGSKARVYGILDSAPDMSGYGGLATRIRIRDAVAEPLTD